MSTADEILKLIEAVDPSHTEKLYEIDARVLAYLRKISFSAIVTEEKEGLGSIAFIVDKGGARHKLESRWNGNYCEYDLPQYTRSRDALKAIRPKGWRVFGHSDFSDGVYFGLKKGSVQFDAVQFKTEELAELHAIIQAIQWERENGKR